MHQEQNKLYILLFVINIPHFSLFLTFLLVHCACCAKIWQQNSCDSPLVYMRQEETRYSSSPFLQCVSMILFFPISVLFAPWLAAFHCNILPFKILQYFNFLPDFYIHIHPLKPSPWLPLLSGVDCKLTCTTSTDDATVKWKLNVEHERDL